MRLFPAGVSVVTADADGDRIGVTMGSLVSLSLEPPLVGIAVGKDNALHELLRSAGAFGVSLLRGDQADVAARFALGMPPLMLWEDSPYGSGTTGVPLLAAALGWLRCPRVGRTRRRRSHVLCVRRGLVAARRKTGAGTVYRGTRTRSEPRYDPDRLAPSEIKAVVDFLEDAPVEQKTLAIWLVLAAGGAFNRSARHRCPVEKDGRRKRADPDNPADRRHDAEKAGTRTSIVANPFGHGD